MMLLARDCMRLAVALPASSNLLAAALAASCNRKGVLAG